MQRCTHTNTHTHGARHMQTKSYKCSIHCCIRISQQVTKPRFRIFMSVINMCFLVTSLTCHVGYPIWLFCTYKHTCHALYAHKVYMYDLRVVYHTTHSTHTHTHTHTYPCLQLNEGVHPCILCVPGVSIIFCYQEPCTEKVRPCPDTYAWPDIVWVLCLDVLWLTNWICSITSSQCWCACSQYCSILSRTT
jgi:hypothetical protein